jgi:sec-independent protein translocase protein TatB
MLDVGFSEILLTSAIALIVLGPERLPKVARQVGNWMGRARAMARQLSEQLEREVNAEELLKLQSKAATDAPKSDTTKSLKGGTAAAVDLSSAPAAAPAPYIPPAPTFATAPVVDPAQAPTSLDSKIPLADPVYGLAASATTAAAMHAVDQKPPNE